MKSVPRPYCLRCFEPLDEAAKHGTCPACGFVNLRALRTRYWNRNAYLISLENTLKAYIVFGCLAAAVAFTVYIARARAISLHSGWLIAFPVTAAGVGLWQTASRLTRRKTYFSPVLFWCLVFVLLGIFFVTIDFRLGLLCLAGVLLTVAEGKGLDRWKAGKVASGSRAG